MKNENGLESLKQNKLQDRVRESILREIKNGSFSDGKLPTEGKLAQMLGVSRATISITLAYMEREGIVVRRHGSATYVNLGYNDIHTLINQGVGVYDLIKQNGYEPSLLSDVMDAIPAGELGEGIAEKLKLDSDDVVHRIRRVFAADKHPAVLTEEYIPAKFLTKPLDLDNLPETLYKLTEQYCISPIEFTLVEIIPYRMNDTVSALLQCPMDDPVLLTEELHLMNNSKPIVFSKVFVRDKYIRFQAIRIRQ